MKHLTRSVKHPIAILLTILLCGAHFLPLTAVSAAEGKALSNLHGLTGTWSYEGDAFVGKSGGTGDVFAISEDYIAADDLFTYEATVTSVTSNPDFNASLIFGLKNPERPTERFYDFGIMTGSHRFIRFDQTNGFPESGVDVGDLPEQKNTYRVKIVRSSAEEFEYFIDGVSVLTRTHLNFAGGYVGMMTNDNGTYEDIKLTITGKVGGEESGFVSNLTGWTPINGTWKESAKGYVGITWGGDTWAYAQDAMIPADTSFVYEADVEIKAGNHAAGMLFGVHNPESAKGHPDRLISLLVARGDGNVMVFAHKDGSAEWIEVAGMSAADKQAETYRLRMEVTSSGSANFFVNDTLYKSLTIPGYGGGYLGLMVSGGTTATFNHVRYTPVTQPVLEDIAVEGIELDSAFTAEDHTYWASLPYSTEQVKLSASFDSGMYEVTVGGSGYRTGDQKTIPLNVGQTSVQIMVKDPSTGMSATYTVNLVREPNPDTLYKEESRPKYHFTPYTYQMNDPNGLVYNATTEEYHLFFQCNRPFDTGVPGLTGTTSWGHAVSKDLVNWEELPLAVMPDDLGMAWSGSAVIDYNNTSGLFDESTPPASRMVLFYASVGGDTTHGYAKESLAYSKDGGRTFIKYEGNPVVKNPNNRYGGGLRDPKVFWYEDGTMEGGGIWVMVTVGNLHIFTSRNLIDWKHCGRPVGVD
ncbi:MAG: cadherin-like beta sandwich domain-containing protein, partial [Clostridia bacterium]|nr:cadherin-like beta sandwich domain-containing protein [Clostridia bacterium]